MGKHNTPDGTCMRDYIHVEEDIINTHIKGMEYLLAENIKSDVFLGYGLETSVMNILNTFKTSNTKSFTYNY